MTDKATGSCLCRAVQFEIVLPTKWCAHCHCTLCRRAHGAGFVTWVGAHADRFSITAGESELRRYHSSPEALRSFCGNCGSTLFFESQKWPDEMHIVLANIDTAIDREPVRHVFAEDHVSWVPLWDMGSHP